MSIFQRRIARGRVPTTRNSESDGSLRNATNGRYGWPGIGRRLRSALLQLSGLPNNEPSSRGKTDSLHCERLPDFRDMPGILTAGAVAGLVCPWLPISNTWNNDAELDGAPPINGDQYLARTS